ncbi:DNA repair protein Rad26 [Hirsutella rhossiliensis]|uniref:DNA repair protein Rad26 n=1 Tax=Hirsutella rhossiliensis TaxID=111463 RepID=A0A9P8MTU3_9HYPO|nr:DNA repair protein Rad26 [Hirsutella rhossiliensis]KAH0961958.1 DNA repair protein Rad26 [Hirsutella rhossiliensis]
MDLDEFSDDGFDDLTDHALQELERNAIQLTQAQAAPRLSPRKPPSQEPHTRISDYGWEEEDDDLDNSEVINDAGLPIGRPVVDNTLQQRERQREQQRRLAEAQLPRRPLPQVPNPRWNPTVDPANRPGAAMPARPQGLGRVNAPQPSQLARPILAQNRFAPSQQSQAGDVVQALQQRLRALEAELNAARGEASIIRANSAKAQQEYEAQTTRLKKLNAEQVAKQERIVEAAIAAERSANTELQFLQRDMREVSDRARRKETANGPASGMTTPKKASKTWGFADGFDEMDMAESPSKTQARTRGSGSVAANVGERTPSKGKRKRPIVDSPVAALETHTEDVVMAEDRPVAASAAQPLMLEATPAAPFEFLQLALDHGAFQQQPPTFDTLSRVAFPSDPTATSLASMIFEKLPLMGDPRRPMQLLVDFAEHIISLWARCVEEQFWEPVKYLVALISFTFDLHTISVAPLIVANLAPIAQATMLVLAEARRRLLEGTLPGDNELGFLEEHIDTTRILSLLYMSALACATTPSETENGFEYTAVGFWRLMSLDVVLLLLTPKQKLSDIIGMLDLLASSSLPGSIGPVTDEADPVIIARAVIERVSAKLTEQPRPSMAAEQRRRLRLTALRTLVAFALYPFGALQLASHNGALPRLVTCLSASIDDLYDQPVALHLLPPLPDSLNCSLKLPESTASADLYCIISQSVLLIHRLVTDPSTSNVADISQKLSVAHGGSQRYLLALGRLTFAEEDLIIEAGIEAEVAEAAHELLELNVTPDDGEAVGEAFGALT